VLSLTWEVPERREQMNAHAFFLFSFAPPTTGRHAIRPDTFEYACLECLHVALLSVASGRGLWLTVLFLPREPTYPGTSKQYRVFKVLPISSYPGGQKWKYLGYKG
jgi:hypothetical protein